MKVFNPFIFLVLVGLSTMASAGDFSTSCPPMFEPTVSVRTMTMIGAGLVTAFGLAHLYHARNQRQHDRRDLDAANAAVAAPTPNKSMFGRIASYVRSWFGSEQTDQQKTNIKQPICDNASKGRSSSTHDTSMAHSQALNHIQKVHVEDIVIFDHIKNKNHQALRALVSRQPNLITSKANCGETPFVYAAQEGNNNAVRLFIGMPSEDSGVTQCILDRALMEAVHQGHIPVTKTLLFAGANAKRTYGSYSILEYVAKNDYDADNARNNAEMRKVLEAAMAR